MARALLLLAVASLTVPFHVEAWTLEHSGSRDVEGISSEHMTAMAHLSENIWGLQNGHCLQVIEGV